MPNFDTLHTPFLEWLPEEALKANKIDQVEANLWKSELQVREFEQRFFACVNMVTVAGSKPTA